MQGSVNARSDVSRAYAKARDTRKDAMTKPDLRRWCLMPYTHQNRDIDLQLISTRNEHARQIVAGFASSMPAIIEFWRYLDSALDDAVALSAQVIRLSAELDQVRLDRANLRAAMRATLAAHAEGEPDPMWYLRDELDAPESLPANARRPR